MSRPARVSPERILSAAALEFSARGFSGARVDRIARRARVNKAMLYYHFGNKQGLYRALLLKTFGAAAERLNAVAAGSDPPEQKVGQLVVAFADIIAEHA
ncbi:MAG: TetR family transcriptional regulator, partial [Vicinamibacterales bacterium]